MKSRQLIMAVLIAAVAVAVYFIKKRPQTSGSTELSLWEHEKEDVQALLDKVIVQFEKQNEGIKVKRSHYKTEDLRTQYQTAALGGGGPELMIGPNDFAGPLSLMGTIKAINEIEDLTRFYPEVVQTVTDPQGKVWGLPISRGNHLMLFVNKKLIEKAPLTLEELVIKAKEATKGKVYGFAYNLNEPFWFATFMSGFGAPLLKDGQPDLDSSAVIDALTFVHHLKFVDKVVPSDCDYTCADTLFVEGKAAMTINGDWTVAKYEEALKGDLIIAPLPKLEKTGVYMQPMVSGKFVFFNSKTDDAKFATAKKFADYLASDEIQAMMASEGGRLPAAISVAESDIVKNNASLAASQAALAHGQPMPMDVALRAVWDAIRPQLQSVMSNRTQPKIAANEMQKDALVKIKEMKQ